MWNIRVQLCCNGLRRFTHNILVYFGVNWSMKEKASNGRQKTATAEKCGWLQGRFRICAQWLSRAVGSPQAFLLASASIILWAVTGPLFHFSDTWQLVINTATTIITFLMVFLIQKD